MKDGRVLFIDAYDSFSNSIITLLQIELCVSIESIKIDDARFVLNDDAFLQFLDGFDAVVAGPGPGHPSAADDVGVIRKLWALPPKHVLPVLGICLGFQSLCLAFGAQIERLAEPRHGIVSPVTHQRGSIFASSGEVIATQYHSLHARLVDRAVSSSPCDRWEVSGSLMPLAWDLSDKQNGDVLMAVKHTTRPFWGLQYHPESICTNHDGRSIVCDWWHEACKWREDNSRRDSGLSLRRTRHDNHTNEGTAAEAPSTSHLRSVTWISMSLPQLPDVAGAFQCLRALNNCEPLLLESGLRAGRPVNPETGRFSILCCPDEDATTVTYSHSTSLLQTGTRFSSRSSKSANVHSALSHIDSIMADLQATDGPQVSPFWGGYVGFLSYEAGLETINVQPSTSKNARPDLMFTLIERSVIFDHCSGTIYVQSIRPDDQRWINSTRAALKSCAAHSNLMANGSMVPPRTREIAEQPREAEYCEKVVKCQSRLRAGDSYELCLTDRTIVRTSEQPWTLYERVRKRNPAPFGAYLRMLPGDGPGITVISSSPERFLSWSRDGTCQFRPIKGTVKKTAATTRIEAEEILKSPKEQAENLMIVDLIRHDLSGVPGIRNVRVPKLMSVEEYETVFQLVSVIEGDLDRTGSGSSVLAASLPPGSMTGAPKKRSCEILTEIEGDQPRGLYSGVIGYFDVGGGGDFSVVIRTAFKLDDDEDEWTIGAGGAITALSEPTAEWEEMLTKRESLLPSFLEI